MTQPGATVQPAATVSTWARNWGHLSVTVALGVFLWDQYEASTLLRHEMQTQIQVNVHALEQVQQTIESLNTRLDVQRDDITALRGQLIEHARLEMQRSSK